MAMLAPFDPKIQRLIQASEEYCRKTTVPADSAMLEMLLTSEEPAIRQTLQAFGIKLSESGRDSLFEKLRMRRTDKAAFRRILDSAINRCAAHNHQTVTAEDILFGLLRERGIKGALRSSGIDGKHAFKMFSANGSV